MSHVIVRSEMNVVAKHCWQAKKSAPGQKACPDAFHWI